MNNIVIYTCITGGYDKPYDGFIHKDDYDYILFSDEQIVTKSWKNVVLDLSGLEELSNVKHQRYIKTHPHIHLNGYEISVWVDGNTEINDKLYEYIELNLNHPLTFKIHPDRNCIYDEIVAVYRQNKETLVMCDKLLSRYKSEKFPTQYGLFETNIIIRKHNNEDVIKLMELWWNEIKNNSHRDQLSLTYVLWKYNLKELVNIGYTKDFPAKLHK